jgi:hypothetical protein
MRPKGKTSKICKSKHVKKWKADIPQGVIRIKTISEQGAYQKCPQEHSILSDSEIWMECSVEMRNLTLK